MVNPGQTLETELLNFVHLCNGKRNGQRLGRFCNTKSEKSRNSRTKYENFNLNKLQSKVIVIPMH